MSDESKKIIEINGIKVEVDLRTAKKIDTYRVGDSVKVLKKGYGDSYDTHIGSIVGFDEFQNLPSMTIAYVEKTYNETKMSFVAINKLSKDIEIAPLQIHEKAFDFKKCVATFDRAIREFQVKIEEIESKKSWFEENYQAYFKDYVITSGVNNEQ